VGASKKGVALACLDAARPALQTVFHSFSLLTLPGDAGTWSVTVFISSDDQALKKLRDPKHRTALVAACPLHAHWLDGEPDLRRAPMGGILDRYRRFVDGVPVATDRQYRRLMGPDTNPSLARGITMGLMHALGTIEVVQQHLDNPPRAAACTRLDDRDAVDTLGTATRSRSIVRGSCRSFTKAAMWKGCTSASWWRRCSSHHSAKRRVALGRISDQNQTNSADFLGGAGLEFMLSPCVLASRAFLRRRL
jgi:hypothetical protein